MRFRLFFLIFASVLLLSALFCAFGSQKYYRVLAGYTSPLIPNAWQEVIMNDVNAQEMTVLLDGLPVEPEEAKPFLNSELQVMLPEEMITELFSAFVSVDQSGVITLVRGDKRVTVDTRSDLVTVNGESGTVAGASLEGDKSFYVSASLLAGIFHYQLSFDASDSCLSLSASGSGSFLPSAFSYEEVGKLPEVQDQGSSGSCWAFAALSALESTLLPSESFTFVREHLMLRNSYRTDGGAGGDSSIAVSYLLSWRGPVADDSEIYGDGEVNDLLTPVRHVQSVLFLDNASVEEIKQAVFLKGGVAASLYLSMADPDAQGQTASFYNAAEAAYCYNGTQEVNHEVVIVGWDDDFSRSCFPEGTELPGNGAFLCLNSWGKDFGNGGLFWVSYYDTRFAESAVCYSSAEKVTNYYGIYQSDLCGATANAGYGKETVWMANVYTAEGSEALQAVGFYTLGKNSSYEVYVVTEVTDSSSLRGGTQVKAGSLPDSGYFTIPLDGEILLEPGQRFAVVVKLTTPGLLYPAAVEKATDSAPEADISDGEGYLSTNGFLYKSTEETSSCNVCLKAYTGLR